MRYIPYEILSFYCILLFRVIGLPDIHKVESLP